MQVMTPIVVKPVTRDTFVGVCGIDFSETDFEVGVGYTTKF